MGCGAQKGFTEVIRGTKVDMMMRPKIKFEIVVSSEEWKEKRSKLFRNLHLQEKLVTGRSSVTK